MVIAGHWKDLLSGETETAAYQHSLKQGLVLAIALAIAYL